MPPFPHQFASAWALVGEGPTLLASRGIAQSVLNVGDGFTFTLDQAIAATESFPLMVPGSAAGGAVVQARAWVTRPTNATLTVICTIGAVEARAIRPFYVALLPLTF